MLGLAFMVLKFSCVALDCSRYKWAKMLVLVCNHKFLSISAFHNNLGCTKLAFGPNAGGWHTPSLSCLIDFLNNILFIYICMVDIDIAWYPS